MLKDYINNHPLKSILILAMFLRIIAVFLSGGFMMFDDHFLLVEIPHAWTVDYDYDFWLPHPNSPSGKEGPAGFSLFYPGFQYLYFEICSFLNITNPQIIMWINRLLHAIFSLFTIYYAYKIAEKLGNKKTAFTVGLLLSTLAIFPNMSVRTLVEMVGIPFVMCGIYFQIKALDSNKRNQYIFWGAFILGISFSVRFQNALFLAGVGLYYLLKKEWKNATLFALGGFSSMLLFQLPDVFIFGEWFAELKAYVDYNNTHKYDFLQGGAFKYIGVILVACGVPISIAMLFGFFRYPKKYLILFLPGFLFLAFHSYFPNKQERFILPAVPLILTNGILAWNYFESKSKFWLKNLKLHKGLWIFFWVTNTLLLALMTTHYTKRARVKAAEYVYNTQEQVDFILIEESDRKVATRIPLFYMGQYPKYVNIVKASKKAPSESGKLLQAQGQEFFRMKTKPFYTGDKIEVGIPNYVFIVGEKNIDLRLEALKKTYPNLQLVYTAEPSFMDSIFQKNKRNNNRPIYVYKNIK